MNLPNSLTLLRIFFVPVLIVILLTRSPNFEFWGFSMHFEVWGVLILLLAAATDWADGYLARRRLQVTTLGILLDPIADKLLLCSSFIALSLEKKIFWWLTVMVISRDVLMLVVAAVILIIMGYRPFPPTLLGKATTFFEIAFIFLTVYTAAYPADRLKLPLHYLTYLVAVLVTVSGFHYCFVVARRLHSS